MIDAVIFDMDGTLFDTERVYEAGWLDAGVSLELYHRFIGTRRRRGPTRTPTSGGCSTRRASL